MNRSITLPPQRVTTIETFPFRPELLQEIEALLAQHDIRIEQKADRYVLHFPEGTYKVERLPRVREARYDVQLPDGYILYETLTSHEGEPSLIRLNCDDFSEALQNLFPQEPSV